MGLSPPLLEGGRERELVPTPVRGWGVGYGHGPALLEHGEYGKPWCPPLLEGGVIGMLAPTPARGWG